MAVACFADCWIDQEWVSESEDNNDNADNHKPVAMKDNNQKAQSGTSKNELPLDLLRMPFCDHPPGQSRGKGDDDDDIESDDDDDDDSAQALGSSWVPLSCARDARAVAGGVSSCSNSSNCGRGPSGHRVDDNKQESVGGGIDSPVDPKAGTQNEGGTSCVDDVAAAAEAVANPLLPVLTSIDESLDAFTGENPSEPEDNDDDDDNDNDDPDEEENDDEDEKPTKSVVKCNERDASKEEEVSWAPLEDPMKPKCSISDSRCLVPSDTTAFATPAATTVTPRPINPDFEAIARDPSMANHVRWWFQEEGRFPSLPSDPNILTIVFDLDETLVNARQGLIVPRPHLRQLLQTVSDPTQCEVIVWTKATFSYAKQVLAFIDQDRVIQHCICQKNAKTRPSPLLLPPPRLAPHNKSVQDHEHNDDDDDDDDDGDNDEADEDGSEDQEEEEEDKDWPDDDEDDNEDEEKKEEEKEPKGEEEEEWTPELLCVPPPPPPPPPSNSTSALLSRLASCCGGISYNGCGGGNGTGIRCCTSQAKDVGLLGRNLDRVLLIDNNPACVSCNPANALLVPDFLLPSSGDNDGGLGLAGGFAWERFGGRKEKEAGANNDDEDMVLQDLSRLLGDLLLCKNKQPRTSTPMPMPLFSCGLNGRKSCHNVNVPAFLAASPQVAMQLVPDENDRLFVANILLVPSPPSSLPLALPLPLMPSPPRLRSLASSSSSYSKPSPRAPSAATTLAIPIPLASRRKWET